MIPRLAAVLAGAVLFSAGAAQASPDASQPSPTLENRAQLVAARMSQGASYDQATRAVPLPVSDEWSLSIANEMNKGRTYREARLSLSERAEVVNARWTKHELAMEKGGSHEAGWAASASR